MLGYLRQCNWMTFSGGQTLQSDDDQRNRGRILDFDFGLGGRPGAGRAGWMVAGDRGG
jgi:hypothetical protein